MNEVDNKSRITPTALKISVAMAMFFLLLCVLLTLYPARFHIKNKFLTPPLGSYFCVIYDANGNKLAEGRFSIAHHSGSDITGAWQFSPADGLKQADDKLRDFTGQITKDDFEINLQPTMADANDLLHGKIIGETIRGDFMFCGFAGCVTQGSFEAVRE